MNKLHKTILCALGLGLYLPSASAQELATSELQRLIQMPLKNIFVEYPNKPGHTYVDSTDLGLSPRELHPAFYGCFDWHSAVHSHWMLAEVLRSHPDLPEREAIIASFDQHLTEKNMRSEASYFDRKLASTYERTYGWAWLLKLSEELHRMAAETDDTVLQQKALLWAQNVDILATKIVAKWKAYLPKLTYSNRVGTHSNLAFALSFAIDYARQRGDKDFEQALIAKARELHLADKRMPAEWEPNATDFFSPTLMVADLMTRVLPQREYVAWLRTYFTPAGIARLCQLPQVSDLSDYTIVHLVGLAYTRAWTMARIARYLPQGHPLKDRFGKAARAQYQHGMGMIFRSNYGGDHWLASFARYAYEVLQGAY